MSARSRNYSYWMIVGSGLLLLILLALFSINPVPGFYRDSLALSEEQLEEQGRLLEKQLLDLSNQVRMSPAAESNWAATFQDSWINGWLASDLPEKFPGFLPDSIVAPRVSITENQIHIAFTYRSGIIQRIVEIRGDLFATQQDNQVAVRIYSVHSGWIPIPVAWWADQLALALLDQGVILQWTEIDYDPVALITLPSLVSDRQRRAVITGVQFADKTLSLSGQTTQSASGESAALATGSSDNSQH